MANYTSMEHLKFLLKDVHQLKDLFQHERFAHLDEEQAWMIIESAKLLADQTMYPVFKEMDVHPATYDGKGGVTTHPQLKTIMLQAAEQHWIGGNASFEHGGLQLPEMIFNTGHHLFQAANNSVAGYLGLSGGAAGLITSFGDDEQIKRFVPPIFEGKWQGTMALTEPQAGSSLSDIKTTAFPTSEEYYLIKGQKIFISGGQHGAADNFIHLTLARLKDAPPGIKGISLFIIPTFRIEANEELIYNDVFCAGDFQKMGQKGYATTHLSFGDNDDCRGYLVGEANKGLSYMFQMMNGARIAVGQTAAAVAMAAYQASLHYALERPQGRSASEKDPLMPPTLIINHPDVQRMLLTQKAIIEGSLSLGMECNRLYDLTHASSGNAKEEAFLLLEILTPIMKTYAAEQGSRSTALAIQTLGGYGFTTDFPVQQYYRDIKIMSLYEGTTGIQSLDLLGRKITMLNGKALQLLNSAMNDTIQNASTFQQLLPYANQLNKELNRIERVVTHLQQFAKMGLTDRYLADASVFMEMCSYIVIGWQWLKQATVACSKLTLNDYTTNSSLFYHSKVHTMEFYFHYELTHTAAFEQTLLNEKSLTQVTQHDFFA